jgi:hypothetical protein
MDWVIMDPVAGSCVPSNMHLVSIKIGEFFYLLSDDQFPKEYASETRSQKAYIV